MPWYVLNFILYSSFLIISLYYPYNSNMLYVLNHFVCMCLCKITKQIILMILIKRNKYFSFSSYTDAYRTEQKIIKNLIQRNTRQLEIIINLINNAGPDNTIYNNDEVQLLPEFPLSTVEEFFKFDTDLQKDREIRKQLVSTFLFLRLFLFSSSLYF